MTFRPHILCACSLMMLVAGGAMAEPRISAPRFVEVKEKPDPDKLTPRTRFTAVVSGVGPGLREKDFVLKVPEDTLPVSIQATKAIPYSASDDDLSIFILVQGSTRFMGDAEGKGYFEEAKQAIDVVAHARPKHTRVGLYVYGDNVVEKAPMGPPEAVTGELLGTAADYETVTTKALQRGLEESLRVLSNEPGRRVLFLISDGGDQIDAYSPRHDAERLDKASIEVYALGGTPKEALASDKRRLEILGRSGAFRYANQREQVVQLAGFLVNEMNNVYTVEFPDVQASDGQMLPVDGGEHDVVVKAGADESQPLTLRFPGPLACLAGASVKCMCAGKPPKLGPPCASDTPPPPPSWIWWLIGVTAAVAAVGVYLVVRRRDPNADDDAEAEDGAAVAPQLHQPPVAPVPPMVEARKTIGIAPYRPGDEEGYPLVAWIVPVTGSAAYRTFRLNDRTVIGAANDCDVRMEDPHMSAHHAEIVLKEGHYVLVDRDSRNGVQFCDKKVERHTLIDNDTFTCGSTSFKFKSTWD